MKIQFNNTLIEAVCRGKQGIITTCFESPIFYSIKIAIIALLNMTNIFVGQAQPCTFTYDIFRHERPIGKLIANRETTNGTTTYTLAGTSNVKLLIDLSIKTLLQEVEVGGKLVSYKSVQHVNNYDRFNKFGVFRGEVHEYRDGKITGRENIGPVTATVASLYFREPMDQPLIFSEGEQRYVPIK